MPLDAAAAVAKLTNVQKLVHLAMRFDSFDVEQLRVEILRMRRSAYEHELSIQAARVGCPGRVGRLGNNDILSRLNKDSLKDAESIANTYNYYLALAIAAIGAEVPTANRYVYAHRLQNWSENYWRARMQMIQEYSENSARRDAQRDFFTLNNNMMGVAKVEPNTAMCPVCRGWIARGWVPLRVIIDDAPPYHPRCPHLLVTKPDVVAREECPYLWMGE